MKACARCKSVVVRWIARTGWVCSDCGHVERLEDELDAIESVIGP